VNHRGIDRTWQWTRAVPWWLRAAAKSCQARSAADQQRRALAKNTCRLPRRTRCLDGPASLSARQMAARQTLRPKPGTSRSTERHGSTTGRIRPLPSLARARRTQASAVRQLYFKKNQTAKETA